MQKLKFMIMNEYKSFGGTEVFISHLVQLLEEQDHRVYRLYFSYDNKRKEENEKYISTKHNQISKLVYNPLYSRRIRLYCKKIQPDIIIVNNAFSAPLSQLRALQGFPVIQIVHDYTPVCPKSTCLQDNGSVCPGMGFADCKQHCTYHGSKLQLRVKLALTRQVDEVRKRVVNRFICPSQCLAEYMKRHGFDSVAIPNPMQIKALPEKAGRSLGNDHRYIYIGALNENKGIYELLPAFRRFAQDRPVSLHLYGKVSDPETHQYMQRYLGEKIVYHGLVPHEKIEDALRDAYAMIVPSKWMENYPTTVMEGMANQLLVIGSDRGGIPEQLADGRGIVFPFGEHNLEIALQQADDLSKEAYDETINRAFAYVKQNNSYEHYYQELMKVVRDVIGQSGV